jgi:hypothetical protein
MQNIEGGNCGMKEREAAIWIGDEGEASERCRQGGRILVPFGGNKWESFSRNGRKEDWYRCKVDSIVC